MHFSMDFSGFGIGKDLERNKGSNQEKLRCGMLEN